MVKLGDIIPEDIKKELARLKKELENDEKRTEDRDKATIKL